MGEEFAILYFKAKKAELTKSSMRTLDSLSIILKKRTTAHISIVTKSGDLCDMCGARDWDRTNNIATYFVSKGVSEERLSFNVFSSTGDNDKIEIRVFDKSDSSKPAPHPVLKRNQK